jgi:uracil-DNA glycosylase family protein
MSAADFLPERESLKALREAAAGCRGCDLYEDATQTVFGEGRKSARVMLVGETPGDQEDRQGKPFVGPAGRELDKALARAGIDRADAYVTNAVKHFRFQERGKRRIHQKPDGRQVRACRPWLDAELRQIRPDALILMGATAAQALLGPSFKVTQERGRLLDSDLAPIVVATIHPSAILRERDDEARHLQREAFTSDLQVAADALRTR